MAIEDSLLEQLRSAIHRRFAPHRHSALLAAIIAAFAVRPLIGESGAGFLVYGIAMVALLLVALYNINVEELVGERGRLLAQNRRRRILGWALATAAAVERIAIIFIHSQMDLMCYKRHAGRAGQMSLCKLVGVRLCTLSGVLCDFR